MTVIYSKETVPKGTQCEGNNNKQSWRRAASRESYSLHPSLSFVPSNTSQRVLVDNFVSFCVFGLLKKRIIDCYRLSETRSCFYINGLHFVCLFVPLGYRLNALTHFYEIRYKCDFCTETELLLIRGFESFVCYNICTVPTVRYESSALGTCHRFKPVVYPLLLSATRSLQFSV